MSTYKTQDNGWYQHINVLEPKAAISATQSFQSKDIHFKAPTIAIRQQSSDSIHGGTKSKEKIDLANQILQ